MLQSQLTLVNLSWGLVQQTSALFGQELSKQKLNVILYKYFTKTIQLNFNKIAPARITVHWKPNRCPR